MRCLPVVAFLSFCVFLAWATPALAADRDLDPRKLDVDQKGVLPYMGFMYFPKDIISADEAIVGGLYSEEVFARGAIRNSWSSFKPFFLKGVPTRGWVDNKEVEIKGTFQVTSTKKVRGFGTVYVLEPIK